jgi:hypothetical protein
LVQAAGKRGKKVRLGPSIAWRDLGELVGDPRAGGSNGGGSGVELDRGSVA